jgi:uncharacterized protein
MPTEQAPSAVQGVALLLWACSPDDPQRMLTPFFQAAAAAAMEAQVEVYFSAQAVRLLQPGVADELRAVPGGMTALAAMRMAHQHGARFLACADALKACGLERAGLIELCDGQGGAVQFMARTLEPGWRTLVF